MARYTGPVCRLCRREGDKLFLKGDRCYTSKCSFDRKPYAPGMHGKKRGKMSDFALQLREKQKVRRMYGMLEKAFVTQFDHASNERGVTAELFLRRLELRFDNVVFRMGLAVNRNEARQLIRHKHFLLNGQPCNIPSRQLKIGDKVAVKEGSRKLSSFSLAKEIYLRRPAVSWAQCDSDSLAGEVVALPSRDDIPLAVKDHMIVEYYSK